MGCRKPYNPPAITGNGSYLVVEGVINSGPDSTTIKLSRTVNVSSKVTTNPVLNALVTVVNDQGATFPLIEATNGNYVSAGLNLDNSHAYRLNITTADNKKYQSDLTPVTITPPIDSIGYNIINSAIDTGIQIYANAHDATSQIKYFRWDYEEAWSFHAKFGTDFISNGYAIVARTPAQQITYCYANDVSSNIVLGSTAKLQQDIIDQNTIIFIPSTSEKIESEYSILVRQYALTADAYNFWVSLKKNTEQLGSIFDAQPTQLQGNIHCITNPSEPVIGYVSVCTVPSKRIFILNLKLPNWAPAYPYVCQLDSVKRSPVNLITLPNYNIPLDGGGKTYSTVPCVDCTIRGTITPPPFWK
jgi:hypothetical protein